MHAHPELDPVATKDMIEQLGKAEWGLRISWQGGIHLNFLILMAGV